jgi:DNA-binding NarL/FixJ family response regulator
MRSENLVEKVAQPNQFDTLARHWSFTAMPEVRQVHGRRPEVASTSRVGSGEVFGGPVTRSRTNGSEAPVRSGSTHDSTDLTNVLIVDDYALYRDNLATIFAATGSGVAAVAWDVDSLCVALATHTLDVILLNMTARDSASLLREVFAINHDAKVIALGIAEDDEPQIVACAEAGVAGYHLRSDSLEDLLHLIHRVATGESLCSPRIASILLRRLSALASQRRPIEKELVLTSREDQILRLLELGLSNQEIASKLCIAVHTVKNHVHSVLTKLDARSRSEAVARFRALRSA